MSGLQRLCKMYGSMEARDENGKSNLALGLRK